MKQRSTKLEHYFLKDINPVIRLLIISDTVLTGAAGLLGPIFALFIENFIQGGNAAVAGLAAGIYLFTKSVFKSLSRALLIEYKARKMIFGSCSSLQF